MYHVSEKMVQSIVEMTYMILHHVGAGEAIGVLEEGCRVHREDSAETAKKVRRVQIDDLNDAVK